MSRFGGGPLARQISSSHYQPRTIESMVANLRFGNSLVTCVSFTNFLPKYALVFCSNHRQRVESELFYGVILSNTNSSGQYLPEVKWESRIAVFEKDGSFKLLSLLKRIEKEIPLEDVVSFRIEDKLVFIITYRDNSNSGAYSQMWLKTKNIDEVK